MHVVPAGDRFSVKTGQAVQSFPLNDFTATEAALKNC
jgi:hypothetical protein